MDERKLAQAGDQIQSAILGSLPWTNALQGLADAAVARGVALLPLSAGFTDRPFSRNIQELHHTYVTSHWVRDDFRLALVGKMLRTGVGVDQDIISTEAMERMPYYADFLGPLGLWWFAGVAFRAGDHAFVLAIQRTRAQGPVIEAEQEALRRFGCGLSQSATVAARIAEARVAGLLHGLEAMSHPAVLLDGEGCVLQANNAAAAYEGELRLRVGHPLAARSPANRQLQLHLHAAVSRYSNPDDPNLQPVVVHREGRHPFVVRIRRLTGETASVFSAARAIMLIDDLDQRTEPPTELLCDLFKLTPAQARLAALVGSGRSLEESADELCIATATARSYLKAVFAGTGVSRQAELVALLARLRTSTARDR